MWKKINFERVSAICFVALCAGFGLFLGARYLLPAVLPFALAWAVAFAVRPLACALHKRLRLPQKLASVFLVLLFLGLFFFVVLIPLFAIAIIVLVAKHIASHSFKCKHCKKEFYIQWAKVIVTKHNGNEYMLYCPHCKTKDWCTEQQKSNHS